MTADLTYLEFSDPDVNSHKFYEVAVEQETVTIRYGRIHTAGRSQVTRYDTPDQARSAADRKIRDQQRKGYQIVSAPSPQPLSSPLKPLKTKRSASLTPSTSTSSTPVQPPAQTAPNPTTPQPLAPSPLNQNSTLKTQHSTLNTQNSPPCPAPLLWRFNSGATNFGIAVDGAHCWLGNEQGQVIKLDHQGNVLQQVKLPNAVKCIVTDDIWVYGGCDNGNVYDLTGKIPYLAYEIERGLDIFWLAIHDGMLGISDGNGGLTKTDPEGEILWTRLSKGNLGWMLCCDGEAFYHGHSKGVTAYSFSDGRQLWHQPTVGKVLFGCATHDRLYVATSGKQVQCFSKTGDLLRAYSCTASVYSCTTDIDDRYLFAADSSALIYGFDQQSGQRIWQVRTGCGSALSMHHWQDCLYIATNQGVLACIDVSPSALQAAQGGQLPQTATLSAATLSAATIPPATIPPAVAANLATTLPANPSASPSPLDVGTVESDQGVILECFRQGQHLRVRVVSAGYQSDWMVQFPRNLRQEGDRYWVAGVKPAKQGSFYRPYGEIKRLVGN
jgi:predicted DNA-binding WGR domain protein/outer membrane protein assembly factor BamB